MKTTIWELNPGCEIQAPVSYWGDYCISHRPKKYTTSYRPNAGTPQGKHIHVGTWETLEEAKQAAEAHAEAQPDPTRDPANY